mmetsp:Transcript_30623/g.37399  ORF Transcript_30623/g.37399 Transcript_30623/m.37399 type:complete len:166 (+) Transcript_30623:95-592(+)
MITHWAISPIRSQINAVAKQQGRLLSTAVARIMPYREDNKQQSDDVPCLDLEIEELHRHALKTNSKTYIDPLTGFTVFTEIQHLQRGKCCGNRCRHCPYEWANVPPSKKSSSSSRSTPHPLILRKDTATTTSPNTSRNDDDAPSTTATRTTSNSHHATKKKQNGR